MSMLTVKLSDERMTRLAELARSARMTPEQLVEAHLDSTLLSDDEAFRRAAEHVLSKNAELYRRLA